MIDMTCFAPPAIIDRLASLVRHKYDWMEFAVVPRGEGDRTGTLALRLKDERMTDGSRNPLADIIDDPAHNCMGRYFGLNHYIIGQVIAQGPKLFRATASMIEDFQDIDVRLTMDEYRQPYEAIILDIGRYGHAICWKRDGLNNISIFWYPYRDGPKMHAMRLLGLTSLGKSTLAEIMAEVTELNQDGTERLESDDFGPVREIARLCLNINCYLCFVGCKVDRWLDLKRAEKHLKRRPDLAPRDIREVKALRTIQLVDRTVPPAAKPEGSHASPHAHWRRGHWRNQAHGPGHALRRLTFIKAIFVMGKDADPARTETIYREADA